MFRGQINLRELVAVTVVIALCGSASALQVPVFQLGENGYFGFRIPTIVQAKNGDLVAIAEGRVNDLGDDGDIDLVMKRSTDLGATWGPLSVVRSEGTSTTGNPSPVVDQSTGRIDLLFSVNTNSIRIMTSDDNGLSWSQARNINSTTSMSSWTWNVTGPVHGIQLERGPHAGRLVIPADHVSSTTGWGSHVIYSDDHGQTWSMGGQVNEGNYGDGTVKPNENSVVELVDGSIYMNSRNQAAAANRLTAKSTDSGLTLSNPDVDTILVDPQVQGSVLRYSAIDRGDPENTLLFSNPATSTKGDRTHMTVRASFDEGVTWNSGYLVDAGPSAYSDLVKLSSGDVGLLYEEGNPLYSQISFTSFPIAARGPTPFNGVPGDVNQDGTFAAADLNAFIAAWDPSKAAYGGAQSYTHDDLNSDLKVDLRDVFLFRQLLISHGIPAEGLGELVANVPEPNGLLLVGWLMGTSSWRFNGTQSGFWRRQIRGLWNS